MRRVRSCRGCAAERRSWCRHAQEDRKPGHCFGDQESDRLPDFGKNTAPFADHGLVHTDEETREKAIRAFQAFVDGPKPAIGFACTFTICLPSATRRPKRQTPLDCLVRHDLKGRDKLFLSVRTDAGAKTAAAANDMPERAERECPCRPFRRVLRGPTGSRQVQPLTVGKVALCLRSCLRPQSSDPVRPD